MTDAQSEHCRDHEEDRNRCPHCGSVCVYRDGMAIRWEWGTSRSPNYRSDACRIAELRQRLRDQTDQTLRSAEYWHARVVEVLEREGVIPEGLNPNGHPIDQVVGTCITTLKCQIRTQDAP